MYQVWHNDNILSDVRDSDLTLYDTRLVQEDNLAGSFTFKMYPPHPHFGTLLKLSSWITIKKDNNTIYKGRVMDDKQLFDCSRHYVCEGKLAVLNDSIFRPFTFKGSPEDFFKQLVENHNSQVSNAQRLKPGIVTVTDPNDYINRSSVDYLSTWEVINTRLLQLLGGHIRVRYASDGDYLDYLSDYTSTATQDIRFGSNLLDITREVSAQETYTAMIPRGAEINEKRIDIVSVNNGKDYIVNEEAAAKYGIIFAPEDASTWDDVTLPVNLLHKATEALNQVGIKLKETIELSAVDLHLTDRQIAGFNIGEHINIISEPHNIRERYLLRKLEQDINNLQSTKITLGETRLTLTDMQSQSYYKTTEVSKRVDAIEKDYVTGKKIGDMIGDAAEEKVTEVMDGYINKNLVQGNNIELIVTADRKLQINAVVPENISHYQNDAGYQTEEEVLQAIEAAGTGISPTIEVASETETEYVLTISDASGSRDTPNLKGASGIAGKSAYAIAVEAGFLGSEEEWLQSLHGIPGEQGKPGEDGIAATVEVGEVITGPPGSKASVVNVGTKTAAVLVFTIPRGNTGSGGSGATGTEMFAFEIREDGHLWVISESEKAENFYINEAGHLMYRIGD